MNKSELVSLIAEGADISKNKADFALNTAIQVIIKSLTNGERVQLVGFGTFSTGKRAARVGRNPKTGDVLKISAAKTIRFTAGKAFKDTVNKRK